MPKLIQLLHLSTWRDGQLFTIFYLSSHLVTLSRRLISPGRPLLPRYCEQQVGDRSSFGRDQWNDRVLKLVKAGKLAPGCEEDAVTPD